MERSDRKVNLVLNRRSFSAVAENLNAQELKRAFAISRNSFYFLCSVLSIELQKNEEMVSRAGAGIIVIDVLVAICFRMLSNAHYFDNMICLSVSMPTVYIYTHAVYDSVATI